MQLFGHPWSINTRKVRVVFAEKMYEPELVFVDIPRGAHKAPEHLARHPFGKLPVLFDGDFSVYETAAVMGYLDEVLPGASLSPNEPRLRARALQCDRVLQSYFEPFAHPMIVQRMFSRIIGFPADERVVASGRAGMQPALDVFDGVLRQTPYVAGEAFGRADIMWMPYIDYLVELGEEGVLQGRPGIATWWERVSRRPSWVSVARVGLQPYHPEASAEAIAAQSSGGWSGTPAA
jgi:glutathione S-transferase